MPRKGNHTECRECGLPPELVGPLSTRGLCNADGKRRMHTNNAEIKARSGPFYERWARRSHMATVRLVVPLDTATADQQTR